MKKNNKLYIALVAFTPMVCSFNAVSETNLDGLDQVPPLLALKPLKLQLADDDFVFDAINQRDDWQSYFTMKAPHLSEYQQSFTHWVGYHSINPAIALALMDMQSSVLSAKGAINIDKPFGVLSQKEGFSEQLNDVLSRLAKNFYHIRQQQEQAFQTKGRISVSQSAATQAMEQLFAQARIPTQGKLQQLFNTFEQRFQRNIASETTHFRAFAENQASIARPKLQLPWSLGYSWVGGGSHGYDGSSWPHSSIDYAYDWPSWGGQTWSVRSAHGGTVSVLSSCQVRVTDASGWATTYYHMSNVNVYSGQQIGANTHLGYYASNKNQALCEGGTSTGPHLHFSLLYNGYYQSLDNVELSNYEVNTGRWSYDSNCYYFNYRDWNNGGSTFCGWRSMYNYNPN